MAGRARINFVGCGEWLIFRYQMNGLKMEMVNESFTELMHSLLHYNDVFTLPIHSVSNSMNSVLSIAAIKKTAIPTSVGQGCHLSFTDLEFEVDFYGALLRP